MAETKPITAGAFSLNPELMVTILKQHAASSAHEELQGILADFLRDKFGKRQVVHDSRFTNVMPPPPPPLPLPSPFPLPLPPPKPGVVAAPALRAVLHADPAPRAVLRALPRAALRPRGRDGRVPVPHPGVGGGMDLHHLGPSLPRRLVRTLTPR